jgi:uncharacterized repeat protein (TIGR01451 family)
MNGVDITEELRRRRLALLNAEAGDRQTLEQRHGQVWDGVELGRDFKVESLTSRRLRARVYGEIFDPARHPEKTAVKAATYHHLEITPVDGAEGLAWQVADLAPGAGGVITVTAVVSPALTGPLDIANTATISAPLEARPEDNVAMAVVNVIELEVPPPVVDLVITKTVVPQAAVPGAAITYTLTYWNAGDALAQGIVLSDILPAEIVVTGITYLGAEIVPVDGGGGLAWQVADLEPGAGGIITMTGVLSPALTAQLTITNTAIIGTPLEAQPEDNVAEAILQVILVLASLRVPVLRGMW